MSDTPKRKGRKAAVTPEQDWPVETVTEVPVADVVTVATTELDASKLSPEQAAKQFEALVADTQIPAERKTATAENARWFLRKGWIFCVTLPTVEELQKLARVLA